jgi:hypothetical protein
MGNVLSCTKIPREIVVPAVPVPATATATATAPATPTAEVSPPVAQAPVAEPPRPLPTKANSAALRRLALLKEHQIHRNVRQLEELQIRTVVDLVPANGIFDEEHAETLLPQLQTLQPSIQVRAIGRMTQRVAASLSSRTRKLFVETLFNAKEALAGQPDSAKIAGLNEVGRLVDDLYMIHSIFFEEISLAFLREHQSIQEVARDNSITSPLAIRHLEQIAIHGPRMRHPSPDAVRNNNFSHAGRDVFCASSTVREVVERLGVITDESREELERYAVETNAIDSAGGLVQFGNRNWEEVADEHGIQTPRGRVLLAARVPAAD